jgi:hypothetical protein
MNRETVDNNNNNTKNLNRFSNATSLSVSENMGNSLLSANLVLSGLFGGASLHCPGHPIPPLQHPASHGIILPSGVTCPQNWSFVGSVEF